MFIVNSLEMRLFGKPIVIAIICPFVYWTMTSWVPQLLEANWILKQLGNVQNYAGMTTIAILAWALLLYINAAYHYWQWVNCKTPSCPCCGMMMKTRNGRYGLFWGCIRYPSCRGTEDY